MAPAPTPIYPLSLHDALPISLGIANNERGENMAANSTAVPPSPNATGRPKNRTRNMTMKYKKVINSRLDRKSTRLNSSHVAISYAVFCLKKKNKQVVNQKEQE